jgi:hypothetical protein
LTPATGTTGAVTLGGTLAVANGGTGLTTAPTNGQIDIGSTGVGFVRTTITAGTGVSVTNGAGSITVANTGVLSFTQTVPSFLSQTGASTATGAVSSAITLATQTANTVFAGPTTGAAAGPTFRALVKADVIGTALLLYTENPSSPVAPSATAANAVAIGSAAVASQYGGVVQASGQFGAAGDAQHGQYTLRNTTTNATATALYLDGTSTEYILPANSVVTFEVQVAAINTAVTGAGAGFRLQGVAYRGATVGTSTLIGQVSLTVIGRTPNGLTCTASVNATTGALEVFATGVAAANYHWVATMQTTEVSAT